jgi:hypothetical protein
MDTLYASLQSLKDTTARINKASDEAVAAVNAAEKFLVECGIGVTATVNAAHESRALWLGFIRSGNTFRIIVTDDDDFGNNCDCRPWAEWDRTTKLSTVKHLPQLLAKINDTIAADAKLADEAKAAIANVNSFIRTVGGKQ